MKPPIKGMTKIPYGLPLMEEAWMGLVVWAAQQQDCRDAFRRETGYDLERLIGRTPIESMIDKSTGFERQIILKFMDYVTESLWGEEVAATSSKKTKQKS